ncbi:hypothetical protein TNCV_5104731 [Trichonephila clavipes]|nr:hypothetical protein TNCV_5104731 [Trichonephila clavipes]
MASGQGNADSWPALLSSSLVPRKTRRLVERCTSNLSKDRGVEFRRGGGVPAQCRPRHLTMVKNDEVRGQKPGCS